MASPWEGRRLYAESGAPRRRRAVQSPRVESSLKADHGLPGRLLDTAVRTRRRRPDGVSVRGRAQSDCSAGVARYSARSARERVGGWMVKDDRRGGGDGLVDRWQAGDVRASELEWFDDELGLY